MRPGQPIGYMRAAPVCPSENGPDQNPTQESKPKQLYAKGNNGKCEY
jgi:hypothetical protein